MTADDRIALLLGRAIMRAERLEAQLVQLLAAPVPDNGPPAERERETEAGGRGMMGDNG